MDELLARLRIRAQKAGDTGTDEQRERTLSRFMEDLQLSVHPRLLKTVPDSYVRCLYLQWCKHIVAQESREDVLDWMAVAISSPLSTPLKRAEATQETNVVSLFG